jgi:hypothetical protein
MLKTWPIIQMVITLSHYSSRKLQMMKIIRGRLRLSLTMISFITKIKGGTIRRSWEEGAKVLSTLT